jgi:hypothetical protein
MKEILDFALKKNTGGLSPCVIYPVIDKTRTFFVSQRPFPLKLDYVKVNNLNFSASKIINLALAELILKKRS